MIERPRANTQQGKVLAHMERHGSISPKEAMESFNCFRLAARIKDLRDAGWPIARKDERHDGGSHARYYLAPTGQTELIV